MKRVKMLLTEDGNFRFDDIDVELYERLVKEGVPFLETPGSHTPSFVWKNLHKRMADLRWWEGHLEGMVKWAEEEYKGCRICHLQCGKNRFNEDVPCRTVRDGRYFDLFVHPGMDGLDDVLHIMMKGCSLNCFFCHKDQERKSLTTTFPQDVKEDEVVSALRKWSFKHVAFSGGNPDESILAVLKLLKRFKTFKWPILWETHGCVNTDLLSRLCEIVDLFIVTVKFGDDTCALNWCGVEGYTQWLRNAFSCLKGNDADILVRISVIPGHENCCLPVMRKLVSEFDPIYCREVKIYPEFNLDYNIRSDT